MSNKTHFEHPMHQGLNIYPGKDGNAKLVSKEPTKEVVSKTMDEINWINISFVHLVFEDNCWVEVSGSLSEGFCSIYKNADLELFADPPPESIKEMKDILFAFITNQEVAIEKYGFV